MNNAFIDEANRWFADHHMESVVISRAIPHEVHPRSYRVFVEGQEAVTPADFTREGIRYNNIIDVGDDVVSLRYVS